MTTNPTFAPEVLHTALGAHAADNDRQEKARQAQLAFDFDATWEALPPPSNPAPVVRMKGAAGHRLQGHLKTPWPEPLLIEFARDILGAVRISSGYLYALRVVLGNQAHAEQHGYTLEQNRRVDFATEQVMRTINAQMHAAGITTAIPVALGSGRVQTVHCFVPEAAKRPVGLSAAEELNEIYRRHEELADRVWVDDPPHRPSAMAEEEIPY